jgi:tetratricopeptide (TPR) repeat protein
VTELLLALLLQQPSPPPSAAPAEAATAVARARALVNEGQPLVAVEALQPFRAAGDPEVELTAGVAYYHAGDAVRAVETLGPVVSRLPAGSLARREAVQVLGLANYLAGRIADAVPYLEQTRAFAPENTELAYALGMAYIQTRQPEKARGIWSAAFGVDAASPAAHVLNAQMMVRAELDEMAEAELKLALTKDPRLPHANFLLGQTALFRGRLDEAVALLKKELAVNPASAMAFYRLGDAYVRQLQWDPAIAALQKSVWLNPFYSGPYILLGQAYSKKGDLAAAEGMFRRAADYDPNNKAAHYLLGQLLQKTGRLDEARRELEIAAKLPGMSER